MRHPPAFSGFTYRRGAAQADYFKNDTDGLSPSVCYLRRENDDCSLRGFFRDYFERFFYQDCFKYPKKDLTFKKSFAIMV